MSTCSTAGRALSLHLFEHLHGDSRDRGEAMVDLKQLYVRAGFALSTSELPDFLPVVLEYLSCRDIGEARAMLADCAPILATIARSLIARRSCYAAVLQALLVIAGESLVDAARSRRSRSGAKRSIAGVGPKNPLSPARRAVSIPGPSSPGTAGP